MKKIITDFECDNLQYIIDENLVVSVKLDKYYTLDTMPDYIKSLNPLDPDGLEKLKLVAKVEPTLHICQSSLNLYRDAFSDIINIRKENIDNIVDSIIK